MAERLKLAVIGDPHIATPQSDPDPHLEADPGRKLHGLSVELLAATVDAVNAETGVTATLVLGDLTRDSELFNHEVARAILQRIKTPVYSVLGNHDFVRQRPEGMGYPGVQRLDREEVVDLYGSLGFPNRLSRYVAELEGGVVLVVMDCNRSAAELAQTGEPLSRQEDGIIGAHQLGWLDGVLEQITSKGRLPLVAVHHALLEHSPAERPGHMLHSAFRQWRLSDAKETLNILARHMVPLVLSGHLHVQSTNSELGVTNLVTSASVSYPHAWRLLTITERDILVESRRIAAIPACPELQAQSRAWMAQGMGELMRSRLQHLPLVGGMAGEVVDFIVRTDWWPRFCDGTLAGFSIAPADLPRGNPLAGMVYAQIAAILNEYGSWKSARPDPNELRIAHDFAS